MPENEQNPRDVPLADAEDPNMPPVEVEVADIPPAPADVLEKILDALEDHADTTQNILEAVLNVRHIFELPSVILSIRNNPSVNTTLYVAAWLLKSYDIWTSLEPGAPRTRWGDKVAELREYVQRRNPAHVAPN